MYVKCRAQIHCMLNVGPKIPLHDHKNWKNWPWEMGLSIHVRSSLVRLCAKHWSRDLKRPTRELTLSRMQKLLIGQYISKSITFSLYLRFHEDKLHFKLPIFYIGHSMYFGHSTCLICRYNFCNRSKGAHSNVHNWQKLMFLETQSN